MSRVAILIMNLLLVGLCSFLIFQDINDFYEEPFGRFQWYGTDKFYNYLVNVPIVCLGVISIYTQFNLSRFYEKNMNGYVLKGINLIYGICIKIFGFFSLLPMLWFHMKEGFYFTWDGDFIFSLIIYSLNLFFILLGFLMIRQVLTSKHQEEYSNYENILDIEREIQEN